MKLLTLSEKGLPLLDGQPIDGLLGFRLNVEGFDEFPILEAKIAVCLDPKTTSNDAGDNR